MKKLNYFLSLAFLVASLGLFTACGDDDDDNGPGGESTETPATVVDVATSDDDFSSLVAALTKANLVTTLQDDGPFTVFAPTNAAFATFLDDNGFASLEDVPVGILTQLLLNHVVSGKVLSTDLSDGYTPGLADGPAGTDTKVDLYVQTGATVMINDAKVTKADIVAGNGVVHVVDKVIAIPDVVDIALQNSNFSILVQALSREDISSAELIPTLQKDDGTYTVFAPTDAAFAAALEELGLEKLDDIPSDRLIQILKYHVVAGSNVLAASLQDKQQVETFESGKFTVQLESGKAFIDDESVRDKNAEIIITDVQASNGVVHAIDQVILPVENKVIIVKEL